MRYNAGSMNRLEDPMAIIGRFPDRLTNAERAALAGRYIALEIYTPATRPPRRIEAVGTSVAECVRQLRERGLDPTRFEFTMLEPAY